MKCKSQNVYNSRRSITQTKAVFVNAERSNTTTTVRLISAITSQRKRCKRKMQQRIGQRATADGRIPMKFITSIHKDCDFMECFKRRAKLSKLVLFRPKVKKTQTRLAKATANLFSEREVELVQTRDPQRTSRIEWRVDLLQTQDQEDPKLTFTVTRRLAKLRPEIHRGPPG